MKNSFILFIGAILLCTPSFAQNADQEAIKKVCIAESQAVIDYDYDAYASYHVQSADEQLTVNNPDGTFSTYSGWEAISKLVKAWLGGKKSNSKGWWGDFTYVIHGDMAFVAYDSSRQNAEGKTTRFRECRTLLSSNGQWKILTVQVFIDYPSGK